MAAGTEVERLIVRLVGDATKYEKMLKDAEAATKRAGVSISKTATKLEAIKARLLAVGGAFQSAGKKMQAFGRSMALRVTLPIAALGIAAMKVGSDFESGFAGVQKTVNATDAELAVMRQGFKDMSAEIPVAVEELLAIGETAGQLGIKNQNILSFTKTIAQLGVTTNISSEEAGTSLARFANITGMSQDKFSNLGSTIVELGNNLATTERDIVSMATRLAGAGTTVGLTEPQILALAGSLSSVGLEAEAGGTAFSKLMLDMATQVATGGKSLKHFASVTGQSVDEFKNSVRTDAAGAIQELLRGLNRLDAESRIVALGKLGIQGTRMTDAVLRSANAVDLMATSFKTADEAFNSNTALVKEASVRFNSFASQLILLKNQFKILLGEGFEIMRPVLMKVIDAVGWLVKKFTDLSPTLKKVIVWVLAIAAGVGPLIIALGVFTALVGTAVTGFGALLAFVAPLFSTTGLLVAGVIAAVAAVTAYIVPWKAVGEAIGGFFKKAKGFIANFSENMRTLWTWLQDNWRNILKDILKLWFVLNVNMIRNAAIAFRLWFRLQAISIGFMKSLWVRFWQTDFVAIIIKGITKAVSLFFKMAIWMADTLKKVFERDENIFSPKKLVGQMNKDFKKGAAAKSFREVGVAMRNAVLEEFGKMNLTKGFESSTSALKLNFAQPIAENIAENIADQIPGTLGPAIEEAAKQAKPKVTVDMKFIAGRSAATLGSAEAASRLAEFRSGLGGAGKGGGAVAGAGAGGGGGFFQGGATAAMDEKLKLSGQMERVANGVEQLVSLGDTQEEKDVDLDL